jgi:hypothetical protein
MGLSFLQSEAEPIVSPSGHGFSRADCRSSAQGFQPLRDFVHAKCAGRRRPRVVGRFPSEMPLYRVLSKISHVQVEVGGVANAVIAETALPDRETKQEPFANRPSGAALDELNGSFQGGVLARRQQHMKVIRHQHETVQSICSFVAIVQEAFDEDLAIGRGLENGTALPGARSHEVCSWHAGVALRNGHSPQRLKPPSFADAIGTAEAVP